MNNKKLCSYCAKGDHKYNHDRVNDGKCILKNCSCDWKDPKYFHSVECNNLNDNSLKEICICERVNNE